MLAVEIELLAGRYAATAYNDWTRAEWPPHPARFFSALVAALHDRDPIDREEREALLWLERQGPPSVDVDPAVGEDVGRRRVLDVYVPVNDVSLVGDGARMAPWLDADIERPLREARQALSAIEADAGTGQLKGVAEARELVKKEEKKVESAAQKAAVLLPDRRTRQVRRFPVVSPPRSTFSFLWQADLPAVLRSALDRLCERTTRLGHSSSLVRCVLTDRAITPTLVPNDSGDEVLRVVGPGQLARLEEEHARHQGIAGRILPARAQRYGRPAGLPSKASTPAPVFSNEWIVFERVGGARPMSSRGVDLARALRGALLEQSGTGDLPCALSGHRVDGSPADCPHVAFVALPFVGNRHADGSVQGCAIVLPRVLTSREREVLLRLVAAWERDRAVEPDGTLELGGANLPRVRLRRVDLPSKISLNPRTWSRPAHRFITATPIALDRHPGDLRSNREGAAQKAAIEAQRSIAEACVHIGLPRPISVEVSLAPLLAGAQPVRSFPPWPGRAGRSPHARVHAELSFAEPVHGPVLLGAGRFFGLGLCVPA